MGVLAYNDIFDLICKDLKTDTVINKTDTISKDELDIIMDSRHILV